MRTYVNLLLVMVLGGLWHGAAYTYIVWGALHGGALAVERLLGLHRDRGWSGHVAVRAAWFVVVQGVVLTRLGVLSQQERRRGRADSSPTSWRWTTGRSGPWSGSVCCSCCRSSACTWSCGCANAAWCGEPGPAVKAVLAAGMVYGIATLYAGTADFIYFQF